VGRGGRVHKHQRNLESERSRTSILAGLINGTHLDPPDMPLKGKNNNPFHLTDGPPGRDNPGSELQAGGTGRGVVLAFSVEHG